MSWLRSYPAFICHLTGYIETAVASVTLSLDSIKLHTGLDSFLLWLLITFIVDGYLYNHLVHERESGPEMFYQRETKRQRWQHYESTLLVGELQLFNEVAVRSTSCVTRQSDSTSVTWCLIGLMLAETLCSMRPVSKPVKQWALMTLPNANPFKSCRSTYSKYHKII